MLLLLGLVASALVAVAAMLEKLLDGLWLLMGFDFAGRVELETIEDEEVTVPGPDDL